MWHVLPNDVYGSTHVNVWTAASIAAALPSFIPNVTSKTGAIVSLAAALMAIQIIVIQRLQIQLPHSGQQTIY
ncbi:hypothetical protein [Clostridium estertheticum]|uniref:Uncharacterized protein n=1 Tax=Clostridium estertheticum TaxID=238834 RepID=A0A7Y3T004_9CLOT|nr:hypothetical protein [Clostridium estertheticum]MBW9173918.1 hypothetical protein [Clostridium estertheticum]NNU78518.1 hypothetical protein [Clostridium estertheticum]WBL49623.1 hypothetical protein LOR37_22895 [Clostridium estertheticum]WLC77811.1 hypothetical protein KTC99_23180 [Clostridium estertheticum]